VPEAAQRPGADAVLFNSFVFLCLFLPITYAVFWTLRRASARYVWLTITGYVFYGYWDPRFTLLMAFSTLVSYTAGLGFLRWKDARRRRWCLIVPITVDLALLTFFKYAGFLLDSTKALAHTLGSDLALPTLQIVLPVGISFYTFHTITYIVDSYRGTITPTRNLFEFSAYVSLFSQLVAGPIVRFRQIEQDLEAIATTSRTRWLARGVSFFVIGLTEKVILADSLAAFVDPALADYGSLSTAGVWLIFAAYSFQLYFDFAGYSDMAIGLGLMFGLRIPINFNSPYKAIDPSDFWRRWHISLSTCLRDYVYIPLGGNRHGELQAYRNLLLTMLIGGIWHGANWTFVVWGAYHGVLLALYRRYGRIWDMVPAMIRRLAMFVLVLLGWVLFRCHDFPMAWTMLTRMFHFHPGPPIDGLPGLMTALIITGSLAMFGPNASELHTMDWKLTPRRAFGLAAAFGACLALIAGTGASPFLYFQF
jgi:alginate O-acetyltransferase complex protein AlgI